MRMRSPRSAPPVKGLEGSTARIATVFFFSRSCFASALTSVLFPAPGGPVTPTRQALPVFAWTAETAAGKRGSPFSAQETSRAIAPLSPARRRVVMSDVDGMSSGLTASNRCRRSEHGLEQTPLVPARLEVDRQASCVGGPRRPEAGSGENRGARELRGGAAADARGDR